MRKKLNPGGSRLPLLFFAAVFLVLLVFNFMTPLVADDFSYKFSWADVSRIRGLGQIIPSMAVHRQITNGRVLVHGLVQLLLIPPKAVFNVLNALNGVLLGLLMLNYCGEDLRSRRALLPAVCGAFLIWIVTPAFGQVFLWLDGSVNYSWGITVFLLFLWPYAAIWLGRGFRFTPLKAAGFLLLAFAAGALSENGSPSALFAALCLTGLTALREKRLRLLPLAGLAVGCLGLLFLATAPAMSGRGAVLSLSVLAANFRTVCLKTQELLGGLYAIYAVELVLCLLAGADRRKLLLSGVLALSGLVSLACFVFAVAFSDRHFCFTVLFTVLACLLLLSALLDRGRRTFPALLTGLLTVSFLFQFFLGALDITVIFGKSLERERAIREALATGEKTAALEIYVPATKYAAPYGLQDLNPDPDQWPNDSLALYYGLDAVTGYEASE